MKPILFSTPMVQAILDGRKTQTRRVIKFPKGAYPHWYHGQNEDGTHDFMFGEISNGCCLDWTGTIKPPCKPNDVLWVRETWKPQDYFFVDDIMSCRIIFKAGGPDNLNPRVFWNHGDDTIFESCGTWHPSIHMPREAARLFLRVKDVRVERVQDITDEDALKEGCEGAPCEHPGYEPQWGCTDCYNTGWREPPQVEFSELWDSLNAKRGYGWDSNPFVWVITFERTTV